MTAEDKQPGKADRSTSGAGERKGQEGRRVPATAQEPADPAPADAAQRVAEWTADTGREVVQRGDAKVDAMPRTVGETAAASEVDDELEKGGVAFGAFVKSIGVAVAEAQQQLDETLMKTAEMLSKTQIEVIAVFEQQIKDDDGTMTEGKIQMQKLPLANFITPTAYHWSRIHLRAEMDVQEFNSRNGLNIQQKSFAAGARVGGGIGASGISFGGSAYAAYSNSNTAVDASSSRDLAAGKLEMEATLEPRADIELPKPFVLQKGPRLELVVGARTAVYEGEGDKKTLVAQQAELTAVLRRSDGAANPEKHLSVQISDPTLAYTSPGKTDQQGEMTVTLKRRVTAPDQDRPVQALIRVGFGLVSESVGVVL
ncbi:hypothetical protein PV341_22190 [Streptomyces sp. PA03-1a]|nr:hypothetical protein [Streptomyces sp. PA03-1a]MDX2817126.1 hypothetical protein [Streptomyces sp. PA03-5A]